MSIVQNERIQQVLKYTPVAFVVYMLASFFRHENSRAAFYLAFTSLFAIVPTMTVVYSILALIPDLQGMDSKMQSFVFEHFVPTTGTQLEEYLQSFTEQASNLTSVGVVMLFVTTVLMLRKIENAFNTIWHVTEARKGVNGFLLYWALLSLGPVMMGGTFAMYSYVASHKMLETVIPLQGSSRVLLSLLPIVMSTFAFSLAYIAIPNTKVPVSHGILGGLFAALMFDLARRLMTLFLTMFPTYHLVYGAFAAVPIFLMWVLVSWFILLLGAEFVQSLKNFKVIQSRSESMLGNILMVLYVMYCQQNQGEVVDESELLEKMPWIPTGQWEQYMILLAQRNIIHQTSDGLITLTRDLHKYTFAQLFDDCFGKQLLLNLNVTQQWQESINKLYGAGFKACVSGWNIPLAEIFDTETNNLPHALPANRNKVSAG